MRPSFELRRSLLAVPFALALYACSSPPVAPKPPPPPVAPTPPPVVTAAPPAPIEPGLKFDLGAIDPKANPCVDFYDYACGGWRATHPIPPDRVRYSRYAELMALNIEREQSIVLEATKKASPTPVEQRLGAYYAACMDEPGRDARGLAPLKELFAKIDGVRTGRAALLVMAEIRSHGVTSLISIYPSPDPHDATKNLLFVDKGRLGLPSPADYTKTDEAATLLRTKYKAHLERLFGLLGSKEPAREADAMLTLETALAQGALSAQKTRHLEEQDHPLTLAELGARFKAIDWSAYLSASGVPKVARVNVAQPAWLEAVNKVLAGSDLAGVRAYLRALLVRRTAALLSSTVENEVFDFDQRTVRGAKEIASRSKRCLDYLDRDLGDDVGRVFLERHFSDAARSRMKQMVDALVASYRADMQTMDWLSPAARAAAMSKLAKSLIVIGASNRPRSFEGLRIDAADPWGNAWRARAVETAREFGDLEKPVDRETFFEALPQELDGFGSKRMNATGFTAGFLQPPVFDPRLDDAVNFGGMGSVIGHELTHQFDDEGRKFDEDGNLKSWWAPEDVARFEERAQCFVDEYSKFKIEDGTAVDGKLTLGENLADNGGIRLSYAALKPSEAGPKVEGFTPAQRFFLAWGQIRCENVTPEAARRQVQSDPHAPGRWRVDGVVSNVPEFASAFSCAPGSPMAPAKRCKLW